jgi:hypothetical protein
MSRKNCACSTAFEHVHGKAISTAARFGSVAGTVRRLRFPVRHRATVRAEYEMTYSVFVLRRRRRHLSQT